MSIRAIPPSLIGFNQWRMFYVLCMRVRTSREVKNVSLVREQISLTVTILLFTTYLVNSIVWSIAIRWAGKIQYLRIHRHHHRNRRHQKSHCRPRKVLLQRCSWEQSRDTDRGPNDEARWVKVLRLPSLPELWDPRHKFYWKWKQRHSCFNFDVILHVFTYRIIDAYFT